jgi:large subunit ribosomal protein L25
MISLSAKIRKSLGKKAKILRKKDVLPAVLYGPKIKNLNLEIDLKEFEKIYQEAGESSLVSLNIEGEKQKFLVLIHDIQFDSLTEKPIHIDFYQPSLEEETEVTVPIIFEGEAPAVKELGGTLVKNIAEVEVKALPQNLPHEIKLNIDSLKTFKDNIKISDLKIPTGVKILKDSEEIVVLVSPPEKIEEELEKPIEEKVEEVEKIEKKPKEEEPEIETEKTEKTEKKEKTEKTEKNVP